MSIFAFGPANFCPLVLLSAPATGTVARQLLARLEVDYQNALQSFESFESLNCRIVKSSTSNHESRITIHDSRFTIHFSPITFPPSAACLSQQSTPASTCRPAHSSSGNNPLHRDCRSETPPPSPAAPALRPRLPSRASLASSPAFPVRLPLPRRDALPLSPAPRACPHRPARSAA